MLAASSPAGLAARRRLAGAYHNVGIATGIDAASPHELVAMLYEGFFDAVARARGALHAGDTETRCRAIAHAARIVDEGLKAALDLSTPGTLAHDLSDLYAYVCLRLTQANLRADEALLDECAALMQPLRDAWSAISSQVGGRR